jgi:exodeoxyribonuclease V beta subunit
VSAEYAERLEALGKRRLQGYLRGFIDLVFRRQGRYYLVDYKSNQLGPHESSYRKANLSWVMQEHHYFLQYHLYTLALHRYLRARLPDYDYERSFGGVLYAFVRGMSPAHPAGHGVFADRPSLALIEALDALFGLSEAAQGAAP